jgi:hypothetical protein
MAYLTDPILTHHFLVKAQMMLLAEATGLAKATYVTEQLAHMTQQI